MKFIHIADLHLGKMLHQYNLISLQKECLTQILEYAEKEKIDAIVIAGDVYDRSIPSQEAVNLLNDFLSELINRLHIKVYMISGNHDSSDRLNFASTILEAQGLYIETHLSKQMVYHEYENTRFYLLPFVKPIDIKHIYEEAVTDNYNDALKYYLEKQEPLDKNYKNILITHQFVGHNAQTSDSEFTLSVGNSEIIDPHLLEEYDYVALGHLHAPQYLLNKNIRYSGSLLKYSFDEAKQKKGFVVVDTEDMSFIEVPFNVSQDVKIIRDTFNNINKLDYLEKKDDLFAIELEDTVMIPQAIETLRQMYPYVLQLTYPKLLGHSMSKTSHIKKLEHASLLELYEDFYESSTGEKMDEDSKTIIEDLLEKVRGEE